MNEVWRVARIEIEPLAVFQPAVRALDLPRAVRAHDVDGTLFGILVCWRNSDHRAGVACFGYWFGCFFAACFIKRADQRTRISADGCGGGGYCCRNRRRG